MSDESNDAEEFLWEPAIKGIRQIIDDKRRASNKDLRRIITITKNNTASKSEEPTSKLTELEKYRLEVCRKAVTYKMNGGNFIDFVKDKEYTVETLRRWIRKFKERGIDGLDWK